MKNCALCGKKYKNDDAEFGLSCLKKLCYFVDIEDTNKYKDERKLNNKVGRILNKGSLPNEQSKLLTNRYFTLKLLEKVELKEYDKYRISIENDIHKIGITTTPDELKSFKKITLKQANEINKHYKKYKSIFQKINDGDYDAQQYITSGVIRFAFSMYYAKKPYLSDMIQLLQLFILKTGVFGLKVINWNFSAFCLEHSLQKNPRDIEITKGEIVEKIKKDTNFKAKIMKVLNNNKNKQTFNIKDSVIFNTSDLYNSLHEVSLVIHGKRNKTKWNLNITIIDKYDFTELIKIQDYMGEDKNDMSKIFSATGNNLAIIATNCNVVHTYNITIKFSMEVL